MSGTLSQENHVYVEVKARMDALVAGRLALDLAVAHGSGPRSAEELRLIVVELAMNAVRHAGGGRLSVDFTQHGVATVVVEDEGPGFTEQVLADAGRTDAMGAGGPRDPRQPAPGLGSGLAGARRLCDGLELQNRQSGGAVVTARKRLGTR